MRTFNNNTAVFTFVGNMVAATVTNVVRTYVAYLGHLLKHARSAVALSRSTRDDADMLWRAPAMRMAPAYAGITGSGRQDGSSCQTSPFCLPIGPAFRSERGALR
jgi:hypothetical protein